MYINILYQLSVNLFTLNAATVRPAFDDPIPVVNIDLGHTFHANLSNWDLPVPGSPTNSK